MDLHGMTFWILFCAVLLQNSVQGTTLSVSIYTVTSKSVVLRWNSYPGTASFRVSATPQNSPDPVVFTSFSPYTIIGSVSPLTPNTAYTFRVEALDNSLSVLKQSSANGYTAPNIPIIETAIFKQSQSVTVGFVEVAGATSYVLRAETADGSFFSEVLTTNSPGTVSGLQPYTNYLFSVMSANSGGRSQPSSQISAKTALPPPQLNSSSPTNSSVLVSWAPVPNAVLYSYTVTRNNTLQLSSGNTTSVSLALGGLDAGVPYCITVNGWSPDNIPGDSATVCQITRPSSPQSVALQGVLVNGVWAVSVSWSSVQGANLYVATSSTGVNCSSAASPCTLMVGGCGQVLTTSITAVNQAGPSPPSNPISFYTVPCPPDLIRVDELAGGNCSLVWNLTSYTDYYTACVKRDDGVEQSCNTTGTSCPFVCTCGYTYTLRVFSTNQAGVSAPGPVLNKTSVPCCPANMTVWAPSPETLEMEWTPVRGADSYQTWAAANGAPNVICNDTSPICVMSSLTCNTNYSVAVIPCNEIQGCNLSCSPQTRETVPCTPVGVAISQSSSASISVTWSGSNMAANYTVTATNAQGSTCTCQSTGASCTVTGLLCGFSYQVYVTAATTAGQSIPSFSVPFETAPCCPDNLTVTQVTQAFSNVTWSVARGAQSFIASLTSPWGGAKCHSAQSSCLIGCITCGTNYTVILNAISPSGKMQPCTYHSFSTSQCCPSGIRFYRRSNSTLRVQWSAATAQSNYTAQVSGKGGNYTCSPGPGGSTCDMGNVTCGNMYSVMVAPVNPDASTVPYCSSRIYSVFCQGTNIGVVLYRRRRNVA
ncbi:fibronectin type III domain-containing protein 7-like [Brachyhypopomus gauderio]|uniref:fibronectin type III domain-containing protein 7-like n=1 Tax=Brachyhypopomus gauderio TaxID=698409 RepID=UPI004041C308